MSNWKIVDCAGCMIGAGVVGGLETTFGGTNTIEVGAGLFRATGSEEVFVLVGGVVIGSSDIRMEVLGSPKEGIELPEKGVGLPEQEIELPEENVEGEDVVWSAVVVESA